MKVSQYIVDFLSNKGVEVVFSVTGGASASLNDAFLESNKFKVVYCHNEASCAYMADGYFRKTKKPAVCLVTVGPGATNLISGIYGCWTDSIPTFVISGQSFFKQTIRNLNVRQMGIQEADIINTVKKFTKYSILIPNLDDLENILNNSWNTMLQGRMGPVWLDIPADVQNMETKLSETELKFETDIEPAAENHNKRTTLIAEEILNRIKIAKKPILHFGSGVKLSGCEEIANKFIELTKLPFFLTHNSYDLFPTNHELNFGFPGIFGHRYSNYIVQNCDLFIGFGTRLSLAQTGYDTNKFAKKAFKIQIDIDESELTRNTLNLDLTFCGDVGAILKEMVRITLQQKLDLQTSYTRVWIEKCKIVREKFDVINDHSKDDVDGVNPYFLIREISNYLNYKDHVFTDMGTSYQTTYQAIKLPAGSKLSTNTGYAPMGWGLPAALGALSAKSSDRLICITGDGGLMMSLQDLASIPQDSNFILFLYNNFGYLTQRQTQLSTFGRLTGVDRSSGLKFPNYSDIAKAFDLKYFLISPKDNLKAKVSEVFQETGPIFVEVLMDLNQTQAPKLVNRRDKFGKSVQSELDDMWPFISESYKKEVERLFSEIK